jgi:acyl-CoA synthetase (AMP-forming)/AMP-acid ligase II
VDIDVTTLCPDLESACRQWPQRTAVTSGQIALTYQELWDRVRALAGAYRSRGMMPGDRVMCALRTCPEHVVAMHAAWQCGAVHVGVHNELTASELCSLVGRIEPTVLVFQPRGSDGGEDALSAVAEAFPGVQRIVHGGAVGDEEVLLDELIFPEDTVDAPSALPGRDDPAVVFLTSGSTGRSKAVVDTLAGLWGKIAFFHRAFEPGPDDVHLLYLPICHAFGMKLTLLALLTGGRLVLLDRFSPSAALRLVTTEEVTVLPATPTHLSILLADLDGAAHRTDTLRWVPTAAAPLSGALAEQVYQCLGVEIFSVYGCSEGFLCVTTDHDEVLAGSVGRTVYRGPIGTPPAGTMQVVDPDHHTPLLTGELGEIAFGANSPVRYWDEAPVATDGWYHSGDLGRQESDGRLFILGRRKELVNRGGLKVSSGEVEAVLVQHPGVADAAVIPSPDPVLGEAICACVVPIGSVGPTLAEVREFLATTLSRHKLPDELCLLERLPRSSIGKLDRTALQSLIAEGAVPHERLRR